MIKGIIFEGVDGVGKSTLKHRFNKATNFKYFVIDRGAGSLITYGKHNMRDIDVTACYELDNMFARNGFVLVYVRADEKVIRQRLKDNKDSDISFSEIQELLIQYSSYVRKTNMKVIYLDTSDMTVRETLEELIDEINKIGKNYYEKTN